MAGVSKNSTQIALRIPDGLRERIKAAADGNRRSMNSEIVVMLEGILGPPSSESPATAVTVPGSVHQQ